MESKSDWLAEVRAAAGDDRYHLSTGVPLSRRLVLTTAHGIPEAVSKNVQVRFIHDVFHSNGKWRDAKVVWRGETDDLDAALLQIEEVPNLISFIYSNRLPPETTDWEGAGFPAAGKVSEGDLKGQREAKGLHGKFNPWGNLKSKELDLTIAGGLKVPGKWAGISGAPVLCQGRLIGIVRRLPEDFEDTRFSAIPLWRLLENRDFCEKIGFEDQKDLIEAHKSRAKNLLKESPEVLQALHQQKTLRDVIETPEDVGEELFKMNIEEFGKTINWARKSKPPLDAQGEKSLDQILNLVLPCLFDLSMVASSRDQLASGMLVRIPVTTSTVTEIFMAAADKRLTSYRSPVAAEQFPEGKTRIDGLPESGLATDAMDIVNMVDNILIGKYVPEKYHGRSIEERRGIVNDRLAFKADTAEGQHKFYYICEAEDGPEMEQAAKILSAYYNQIVFILLEGNALREELRWISPLQEIYKKQPGDDRK